MTPPWAPRVWTLGVQQIPIYLSYVLTDSWSRGATVTGYMNVIRGFTCTINKVKMQEKIQKDWNSMTFPTLSYFTCGKRRRCWRWGYGSSSALRAVALRMGSSIITILYHIIVRNPEYYMARVWLFLELSETDRHLITVYALQQLPRQSKCFTHSRSQASHHWIWYKYYRESSKPDRAGALKNVCIDLPNIKWPVRIDLTGKDKKWWNITLVCNIICGYDWNVSYSAVENIIK